MRYTVSDFLSSHKSEVKLVAGAGGLSRPIRDVGILDYEFMPGLNSRYERDNFHSEQLVLSTFLYAKDDPYLMVDAIKRLVAKDVSGLVIKNVLHLPLPEQAVRYANARDFPLCVTTSDQAFFDCIVYDVGAAAAAMEQAAFFRHQLDELLEAQDASLRRSLALRLCPSLGESCCVLWLAAEGTLDPPTLRSLERWWQEGPGGGPQSCLLPYGEGLLLVASSQDSATRPHTLLNYGLGAPQFSEDMEVVGIGASAVHGRLEELPDAICEAWDSAGAAALAQLKGLAYPDLGVLKALLPVALKPAPQVFRDSVLGPLQDHDAEHGTALAPSLLCWWDHQQSISRCAQALGQHPNTLRYRLNTIARLTGLSYQQADHAQQLALACALHRCREIRALRPGSH